MALVALVKFLRWCPQHLECKGIETGDETRRRIMRTNEEARFLVRVLGTVFSVSEIPRSTQCHSFSSYCQSSADPDPWTSRGSPDPSLLWSAPDPSSYTASLRTNQDHRTTRPQQPLNHSTIYQDAINPNPIHPNAIHNDNPNSVDPINPNTLYQEHINPNTVYQDPINPNTIYQDPINSNTVHQGPINPNTIYQDPINPNTVYQDPINSNTVYQDPINHNPVYQDPINPDTVYQDPIHPNTVYQDPISHNNVYQDPINHNTVYQEPIDHENSNPIYHNPICQDHISRDSVAFLYPDVEGNSYTAVRRSALWPSRYRSRLMPGENQPLDVGLLRRVKEVLVDLEPRTAAQHITRADCMVAGIVEVRVEDQRRMGVGSGVELLTLAHGHQLRLDLLERYQTMSVALAVFILGCTGSPEERATLLHKAIQMAAQLKSSMGNMFGFSAVMKALELPQVARLEQTWTVLRQRYTEGAVLYQHTLRPFLKALDHGKESTQLTGTSFPHVTPLLLLLERRTAVGEGAWLAKGEGSWEGEESWEVMEAGVDAVMSHLAAARTITQLGGIYCANAEAKLKVVTSSATVVTEVYMATSSITVVTSRCCVFAGLREQVEVSEVFQTDFQTRLLWGSRGADQDPVQRYAKYYQVLTTLSHHLEPPALKH
ncbi:SH2 domain-containing protein 3C [Merluccius polli]|uniref:SH2 domain-containing protein 3C n=1 Tax=Merluccius polli TaxID=89951 RepID=A0AA47NDD8_MERPO|nr:SH2 domain-containing protein 3C [Merluccius polli]